MLNIPHGAYHLLTDDIRRQREMANSDIAPHAGIWKTMMHNKHSSFLVKLTIHDITNVPLVSGSFSVRWKFRGSKGDLDLAPTPSEPTTSTRSKESTSPLDRSFTGALTGRNERDESHHHLPDPSSSSTGFSRSSPESSIYPSPSSTGTSTPAMVPGPMSSSQNVREPSLHNGLASHNKTQSQSSAETQSTMASSQHQHQHHSHHHPHPPGHHHGQTPTGPNVLSLSSRPSVQSLLDKEIASTLLPLPSNVTHNNASASSSRRRHHRDGDDHDQDDPHGADEGQHPGSDQNGRSRTAHLHVPHILLHRSENTSHTSLSSAFSGLSRKKRGAADSVESGSTLKGSGRTGGRQRVSSLASSIDSVPESLRSTGSKSTAEHQPQEVKLDVPLGTVTTVKGRTPIQELEDHGASWEHHVAQIVRIKLRPMDEDAAAAYAKRTGKELKVPSGNSNGSNKEPHGRARQVGASLMGGSKDTQQSSSEPAGWLGGGAKSESGLKLVVYQHLAGMGLETIRSVSTRSEGNEDGDDGLDHGSISSKTSTAKPGRQRHGLRNHSQKHGHHEHDHPGIYFGELNLDLAEYASEEARMGKGGVTRRYLLKGGKTNAMIKMTIELSHYGGETNFVTPPLQRGHNVAGLAAVTENDIQLEHHLANLKAPHNSASSSSVSLAQSQSSMLDRSRHQLLRTVSSATIPLTEQSRVRPKKPPESHFVAPEHQHRFNQLYRRGYRNHGHRAVHDALKMGHREHRQRHRSSGAYSGEWSAEQVIDLIFNPLPVNRIERVTPFTYYAEDAPDDAESVIRVDMEDVAEARVETASIADSTGTIHEKRSRKFLSVLSGHGLRSNSNIPTPKDEHSEKDKGLGAVNGSGTGGKARPKWGRNKTKMNES